MRLQSLPDGNINNLDRGARLTMPFDLSFTINELSTNISLDTTVNNSSFYIAKNLYTNVSSDTITNFSMSPSSYPLYCEISTDSLVNCNLSIGKKLSSSINLDTTLGIIMGWDLLNNGGGSGVLNYIDSNLNDGPHLITVINPINVYFRDKYPMPDLTTLNIRLANRFKNTKQDRR